MISILASLCILSSHQDPAEQIYETTTPSIVTLSVQRETGQTAVGTAFLAISKGIAVTSWHVVKGASKIVAKFADGHEAKVVGLIDKDQTLDVALLAIESEDRPILKIAESVPKVGAKAYVIGSPKGMDFSISDGIISQTPLFGDDVLYQFTCPVSQGNSGGPLLNSSGHVLGVVSWQLRDAQNLNFAIPGKAFARLDATKTVTSLGSETSGETVVPEVLFTVTDDLITETFKQIGTPCTASDDGTGTNAFLFESQGTKISLFQYTKDQRPGPTVNLSLSTGYESVGRTQLELLNKFNRAHRFVRTYRDANGVVYVENDLDIECGVGKGGFYRFVSDFQKVVTQFEKEVLGRGTGDQPQTIEYIVKNKPSGVSASFSEVDLIQILKECGHSVEKASDGSLSFKVGDVRISLDLFADSGKSAEPTSLSLAVGFDVKDEIQLSVLNTFNEQTRFSKVFQDEEGDPILVSDLCLTDGLTTEAVKAFVATFTKTLPAFKNLVGQ